MKKINHHLKTITFILTSLLLIFATPNQAFGTNPSRQTLNFYGINGIYYYNPNGSSDSNCISGSNSNYSGAQVLDGATSSAIQANQAFYKQSADKYGFDWRIIATFHILENSAQRSNPSNGQGAYQLYSYTRIPGTNQLDPSKAFYPAGQISDDEFQRQTDIVAELIANNYGSGLDLSTAAGIKTLFFKYNGASLKYKQKAIAMGFTQEEAETGEGSPYVMNEYDAIRDPYNTEMVSPDWPGMFVDDGVWDDDATMSGPGRPHRPGAYTIYVSMGGIDGGSVMECYIVGANGGRLVAGVNGMSEDEAKEFMNSYKNAVRGVSDSDLITLYGMTSNGCSGGVAYNCVSFTRYFINMYTNDYITNHITIGLGNGGDIVNSLLSGGYEFTDGGNVPQVYAIFSYDEGNMMCGKKKCGHTGVVLRIDTTTDTIIVGEAQCGLGESGVQARTAKLSDFMSGHYHYAYPKHVNGIY